MEEVWKDIIGYENYYQISNTGKVKSLERHVSETRHNSVKIVPTTILKLTKNKYGYIAVGLTKDSKQKPNLVHRLVAQAFIPNPDNLPQVNHKNGIKNDNNVENLEWTSASNNMKHAYKEGLKNSEGVTRKVINLITLEEYPSIVEAARKNNLSSSTLNRYLLGIRKNKTMLRFKE